MLKDITIHNFILITSCYLDFEQGLTVITGPTGSGKSMLLKAISFALGELDSKKVHANPDLPTTVSLSFDITHHQAIKEQLNINCNTLTIERKLINQKSSLRLNGQSTSLKVIKSISPLLICWQRQHAQLALTDPKWQRELIDQMIEPNIIESYKTCFNTVQEAKSRIHTLSAILLGEDQVDTIHADLSALEPISHLSDQDIQDLYSQYKQCLDLEKNEQLLADMNSIIAEISQTSNRLSKTAAPLKSTALYDRFEKIDFDLQNSIQQLDQFMHQAESELRVDIDPYELKTKISELNDLSRRFHTLPELLPEHYMTMQTKLEAHENAKKEQDLLIQQLDEFQKDLESATSHLRQHRMNQSSILADNINAQLPQIGLETGKLKIDVQALDTHLATGADRIEFLASMNVGLPLCPLKSVLSGGELTRIALILNLYTQSSNQTLLLDEVDSGVSGDIAQKIGHILRQVSQNTSALCITHTPQVAASGHWQLQVKKTHFENNTQVEIRKLNADERAMATAQIIASGKVTESALSHAKALLIEITDHY
jgi:DNA repair protein RecN (Recombination protein N)